MELLAATPYMSFLDISFAKKVSDEGMSHFKGKTIPLKKVFVNGLTSISAAGLSDLVHSCLESLKIFEAALMDQEGMTGAFC